MIKYNELVMCAIIMISQNIDSEVPRVCDLLLLLFMNKLPRCEIKAYRDGKRLTDSELIGYIMNPLKSYQMKEGILRIEI